MAFKVTIQEVNVERIQKGKNSYHKAQVTYTFKGEQKSQTLVNFSNPEVFKQVTSMKTPVEVQITTAKNDAGYDQWAKVEIVGDDTSATNTPAKAGVSSAVSYNDRDDKRQLMIVRQSSISNAVSLLKDNPDVTVEGVLNVAQYFVDFVYGTNEKLAPLDTIDQDIP